MNKIIVALITGGITLMGGVLISNHRINDLEQLNK